MLLGFITVNIHHCHAASDMRFSSKAMEPDLVLVTDSFIHQDGSNLLSLIATQLDNLSQLRVLDDRAVAGKALFECLESTLGVDRGGESLDGGEGLAT